jgi:hypothetical protein
MSFGIGVVLTFEIKQANGFASIPTELRFVILASTRVVPEPQNGSRTVSPFDVRAVMKK